MELIRPNKLLHRPRNPALVRPFDWERLGEKLARYERNPHKLWAGAGDRSYSFDANSGLSDGVAAYTTTGFAQYAGANGFIDLGGNQNITINLPSIADSATITPQQARIDAVLAVWITAITTGGTDLYKLILLGSNDASFGAGNVTMLAMMEFGGGANIDGTNMLTTPQPNAVGGSMYELLFSNEQNNVKYEFLQLYNVISGNTSPSITYRANVAVLPEP